MAMVATSKGCGAFAPGRWVGLTWMRKIWAKWARVRPRRSFCIMCSWRWSRGEVTIYFLKKRKRSLIPLVNPDFVLSLQWTFTGLFLGGCWTVWRGLGGIDPAPRYFCTEVKCWEENTLLLSIWLVYVTRLFLPSFIFLRCKMSID